MRITTLVCTRCSNSDTFGTEDKTMGRWLTLTFGAKKKKVYLCPICKVEWDYMIDQFIAYPHKEIH